MKIFKRLICITLAVMTCLVLLTSCAKDDTKNTATGGGSTNKGKNVHVFYYSYSDTYISSVRTALDKKLSDEKISYQDYDGNSNQTTQTEQVQTAITKGAKLLIVNIVNTGSDDAAAGIIELAKNKNIPVIFFNREVSDTVVKSYDKCAFVGTDAAEAGYMQGDMIGDYLVENFNKVDLNGDGKISYIMFKGEEGNNEAIYRTQYSVENANKKLKDADKSELDFYDSSNTDKYLVDKDGKWSATASSEYMTTALSSYNESKNNMIELVICNNDGMAEGAVSALNTAGFNLGGDSEKYIPVFGVDATDAAKQLIAEGKMTGTIKQDAEGMAEAISHLAGNGLDTDKGLMDDTGDYNVDEDVYKVRIAYGIYLGEDSDKAK